MLVTDNAVYVPQFDSAEDQAASDVVRANTEKMVLPVNTAQVAVMGGNVRCTTWQMYHDTDIALALVGQAEKRTQWWYIEMGVCVQAVPTIQCAPL